MIRRQDPPQRARGGHHVDAMHVDRNPNMRVKVANGNTLPVEFIGTIVLRIPAGDVCNGNDDYSTKETLLELRDAIYVLGLCATLFSTKAIFQKQGIRAYLNDDLRLVLPNENHVRIREMIKTRHWAGGTPSTR
eukprot:3190149-Pleurochrysis_carterae.AAC.1